ncbi:MAG: NADH:flavin oxidoreductase [Myxococcales bacterium]
MALFDPIRINSLTLPNRIVKSAMVVGRGERGRATPAVAETYERWSKGGVGLAVTGMMQVRPDSWLTPHEVHLEHDDTLAPLRQVTEAVHRHDGKIFFQLCHAPPQSSREACTAYGGSTAPSAGFNKTNLLLDRALREDEIRAIVSSFGAAAERAKKAGADGVQLHGAHGYLISRFISPKHNRRKDSWGGSFDRRLRFLEEVVRLVRSSVGKDFPVIIKLNAHDGEAGGLTLDEGVEIGRRLEAWGIDAIEVSAGTGDVGLGFYPNKGELPRDLGKQFLKQQFPLMGPVTRFLDPAMSLLSRSARLEREAYFWPEARRFADALTIPVICVGGIRTLAMAERILAESKVAMVSMARPLVRQPNLPNLWKSGKAASTTCTSCNRCFVQVGIGQTLRCTQGQG